MSGSDRPRLCIVGSINMDLVIRAPRLPAPGETLLGGPFSTSPGGKGANQAVAAARMGAQVSFVGAVGDDAHGLAMLDVLRSEGVDTSRILTRADSPTGVALIAVAEGSGAENTIIVAPGANDSLTPVDIDNARAAIAVADILLMQLETPLETVAHAAAVARDAGTTVILNAAPAQRLSADFLAGLDGLVVNETEARAIAGDRPVKVFASQGTHDQGTGRSECRSVEPTPDDILAAQIADVGVRTVILTLAERGAFFSLLREGGGQVPGFRVSAIDTVGAGDAFCGALATRLAEHQIGGGKGGGIDRMAVLDAVCWANAAGALCTLKPGAIPSLPTRAAVSKMLRDGQPNFDE